MINAVFLAVMGRVGGGRRRARRMPRRHRPLEILEPRIAMSGAHAHVADAAVSLQATFEKVKVLPYFQGFNDCGANAAAALIDYEVARDSGASGSLGGYQPSRLFLYYNARFLDNDIAKDSGAFMKDLFRSAKVQGVTSEVPTSGVSPAATWPYSSNKAQVVKNPGAASYVASTSYRINGFSHVDDNIPAMQASIDAGRPFAVRLDLTSTLDALSHDPGQQPAEIPTIPVPKGHVDTSHETAHYVVAVGYDTSRDALLVLNSWGSDWGQNGYAYLPYAYFTHHDWAKPEFAIDGLTASSTAAPTIGGLGDLVARPKRDKTPGQIHIDTTTAGISGKAAAFGFFGGMKTGAGVTPLLFSYNAQAGTYTLTGIGRPLHKPGAGSKGIPFDPVAGSDQVTPNTVFGFFNGTPGGGRNRPGSASTGSIPYSVNAAGTTSWLTTAGDSARKLTIGAVFSTRPGTGKARLKPAIANRTYSAMLVE